MFAIASCIKSTSNLTETETTLSRTHSLKKNFIQVVTPSLHATFIKPIREIKLGSREKKRSESILPLRDIITLKNPENGQKRCSNKTVSANFGTVKFCPMQLP